MDIKIVVSKDIAVRKDAFKVRKAVFVDEQGFYDELDEIDEIAWHAVAYDNEIVIGCGRVFPESENSYHAGRIAVLSGYRNKNVGTMLMKELEKTASYLGASYLVLSAQRRANDFYLKLGYEAVSGEYFEEGYPHTLMRKKI